MNEQQTQPVTEAVSPRPLAVALYLNMPALRSRLARAVNLYKAGAVVCDETGIRVTGSKDNVYKLDLQLTHCDCPDADKAPNGLCKHTLAAGLYLAANVELPLRKPTTLASRVLLPVEKRENP